MRSSSNNTGRLTKHLAQELQSLVYPRKEDKDRLEECFLYANIERAHVLMLLECGLAKEELVRNHLLQLEVLESEQFSSLLSEKTPRGFYMTWERYLQTDEKSCFAHLGRSRNDINATLARLRLRKSIVELLQAGISIVTDCINIGHQYSDLPMAGHTHWQPAMPLSLGHQFYAWGFAIVRELFGILYALNESEEECPMGAGAQGGTNLKINPEYTAFLLGFDGCTHNSLDAVANRSFALHMLAAVSGLALIVNRICQDILFYTSLEVGYFSLSDDLCGSSSMMPQKRNPFLCEIVSAKMLTITGIWNTVLTMLRGTPYTNTAVAGEAMEEIFFALQKTNTGLGIFLALINGIIPNVVRMNEVAKDYYTCATMLANDLVTNSNFSFREAHRVVGEWISDAEKSNRSLVVVACNECKKNDIRFDPDILSPEFAVRFAEYGGGPGPSSLKKQKEKLETKCINIQVL